MFTLIGLTYHMSVRSLKPQKKMYFSSKTNESYQRFNIDVLHSEVIEERVSTVRTIFSCLPTHETHDLEIGRYALARPGHQWIR